VLNIIATIMIVILFNLRWILLRRLLGKTVMFFLDAMLFTGIAAVCFANSPEGWAVLYYAVGVASLWLAYNAGKRFLHLVGEKKNDNG